jgi:para-aminobenzoate synthetase component 1
VIWLDSNDYKQKHSKYEAVLAVEAFTAIETSAAGAFDRLQEYQQITKDWLFGYLTYDLKNDVEELTSENPDGLNFPDLYFFQPKKLFLLKGDTLELQYLRMVDDEMDDDLKAIFNLHKEDPKKTFLGPVEIQPRLPKSEYLEKVKEMLGHIQRGDIYEANFCQEFFADNANIDPLRVYRDLNAISRPPFAGFLRLNERYLLSASPERYLQKSGSTIISQPIKGTAPRGVDPDDDQKRINDLESDPKERSENVMIVDLVRNDLSKTAKKGSVEVEELCRIYSFEQVHQMISTVKSELAEGIPAVEVIKSTFPMGSMTGAPKISAMKIIEELEESRRGLYSGAVGYFTPEDDFDFNVVIRSILYNEAKKYVSFTVGGAITSKSIPENEYLECLVKARALKQVLEREKSPEQ